MEGRSVYLDGKLMVAGDNPVMAVDLIIADYPDGMQVSGVSDPPHIVPNWNEHSASFLKCVMQFSTKFLHDDGVMLIFYPDSTAIKREIMSFFKN